MQSAVLSGFLHLFTDFVLGTLINNLRTPEFTLVK